MKICITTIGSDLDSQIDVRFGRTRYFLLLDEKGKLEEAILNSGVGAMRGAGIAAAQTISSKGVEVLITGNIGPNALNVLKATGVKIFLAPSHLTAKQAFLEWKKDKLSQIQESTVSGHFGCRRGFGPAGPRRASRKS